MHSGRGRSTALTGARLPALLFCLALIPRLLFWSEWNRAGLLALPVVDAHTFDQEARGLLSGTWPPPEPFWQAPLYSFFLAGIYRVFDGSWGAARLAQALLGAATCLLTFLVARRVLSRRWALVPFGICALYGPHLYFEGQLLRETLSTFLLLAWLLLQLRILCSRAREEGVGARPLLMWAAAGALLGVAALARENALAAAPFVVVWVLLARRGGPSETGKIRRPPSPRNRALPAAAFLLGLLVILSPITIWNWKQERSLVPISTSGGVNFFLGNNEESRATLAIRPGRHWLRLVDRPAVEEGATSATDRSRYFYRQAVRWIGSDPLGFLGNTLYKTVGFFSAHEIKRNQEIYEARQGSALLRVLLWKAGPFGFPFGILGPLALLGVWVGLRNLGGKRNAARAPGAFDPWAGSSRDPGDREADLRFLAGVAGTLPLAVILFFPTARYRAPLVPLLAVFGAIGTAALVHEVVSRYRRAPRTGEARREAWAHVLVLAGAVFLVNGGWVRETEDRAGQAFQRATVLAEEGRTEEALGQMETAVRVNPQHAESWTTLAALHGRLGHRELSLRAARTALAIDSTDAQAWVDLGTNYLTSGDLGEAETYLRRALRHDPNLPEAWMNLGSVQLARGELALSEESYGRAVRSNPRLSEARRTLSQVLARNGKDDAGRSLLLDGIRLAPRDAALWFALGNLEGRAGRWTEAEQAFRRALEVDPGNADAWNNLGMVFVQVGRVNEAREAFDRALRIAPDHSQAAANRRRFVSG